jgi:hypothetical protein
MDRFKRKRTYALVRAIFKAEEEIKLAIVEAKTKESREISGGGGSAYKSDPTAGKAARLLCEVPVIRLGSWTIYKPEGWIRVIRKTYDNCEPRAKEIMRRYYHGEKFDKIYDEGCGYEKPTLYVFRRNFENLAVEVACQEGLAKVVDV